MRHTWEVSISIVVPLMQERDTGAQTAGQMQNRRRELVPAVPVHEDRAPD